jgi:hypothetical protein
LVDESGLELAVWGEMDIGRSCKFPPFPGAGMIAEQARDNADA